MVSAAPIKKARSVGQLKIGAVTMNSGVMSVDIMFEANCHIDDDVMKSASLSVSRQFYLIMRQNGYGNCIEAPKVNAERMSKTGIFFKVSAPVIKDGSAPQKIILPDA